jgi:hypothetical protein
VQLRHFAPSARQVVWLAALALGIWVGADRLSVEGPAGLYSYALLLVLALGAIATALFVLIAPRVAFLTAVAAAAPWFVLLGLLLQRYGWSEHALPALATAALYRAQRIADRERAALAAAKAICAIGLLIWLSDAVLSGAPQFWYERQTDEVAQEQNVSEPDPGEVERSWFRQAELVDAALARIAPGEPGVPDTYFVGFAGYGGQRVFDKEVRFARDALARRLPIEARSLLLVNAPVPGGDTPFASMTALRRALAGVAARMDPDEDFLILLLTSHGSEDAELSVENGDVPFDVLRGADLREALDAAGIRWRVIVISACHSASFIPYLEEPQTLVATAARADRKSLGCADDRELTYFGEALFRDALPESTDLLDALARAREVIARHETEEEVAPAERSEPQLFVGERMRAKLAELRFGNP